MVAFPDEPIMSAPEGTSNPNIVTILERDFPEFYNLLVKADMVTMLRDATQITVFAPVWYAFRKVAPDFFDSIVKDIISLKLLVGMHITQGRIASYQLGALSVFPTLNMPVYIQRDGSGSLFLTPSNTKSKVVAVDIPAKNGVIHVVDSLIIPSNVRRIARQYEKN